MLWWKEGGSIHNKYLDILQNFNYDKRGILTILSTLWKKKRLCAQMAYFLDIPKVLLLCRGSSPGVRQSTTRAFGKEVVLSSTKWISHKDVF